MFESLVKALGLDPNDRALKRYRERVARINALEAEVSARDDASLASAVQVFRKRLAEGEGMDELLEEVFAVVREVSRRQLGLRHFDVQLMGGMALHEGKIAEMQTGEGKTLVATLPVVLNALKGEGVHVITVNDYLARRDADWMGKIYRFLGLSVGVIYAFMPQEERVRAYKADITYGTNSEFGFDYLRDNMATSAEQQVQRGHSFCIVDEVDSILIDEARTPLIISGPSEESVEPYLAANAIALKLSKGTDFEVDEKERNVVLTEKGILRCEEITKTPELFSEARHADMAHKIVQALKAHHLFQKDIHYVNKDGDIVIVDEFTGRLMFGRRYSEGLHQAIEAKEHVKVGSENQTLATITLQNYFRMYRKLAGMTGTASTEAEEFKEIYGLEVIQLPTHRPMVRKSFPDAIFRTRREKFNAVADEVAECHEKGQPVLVGTTSIENSEMVSRLLKARKIPHQVLNAKYHEKEAEIVSQAGRLKAVTVATNMAGRGTDILLGGNPEALAREVLRKREIDGKKAEEAYGEILEKIKAECDAEHERVVELGGLHIVGTERHEARRIDNQLMGRSGRQGDPGSSRFFLSLEDDLLRLFGSDRVQGLMEKLGMEEGEAIEHSLLTKAIENAQKKVEQMHFDIRKQLLMYDNVMNQQREAVYAERARILKDPDILEGTREMVLDVARSIIEQSFPPDQEPDVKGAQLRFRSLFGKGYDEEIASAAAAGERERDIEPILRKVREHFDSRVSSLGETMAGEVARFITLHVLDSHWKEHLLAMDELRSGIGLRAIGQKDPLLEYQFESFNLFQEMLERVRTAVAEMAFRISIVPEESGSRRQALRESREALLFPEGAPGAGEGRVESGEAHAEPVRRGPKVGRNDPCPCGSGRKFKHCCGRGA
jgi:preprotein translocase subunit SecA